MKDGQHLDARGETEHRLGGIAQWAHDRRFTWASNKREDFSVPNEAGGKSTVGMERIIAFEKEISQPLRKGLASQRSRSPFGQAFQIQRFFPKHFTDGFAPDGIFCQGMGGVLRQTFEGILQEMQAVPH